VKDEHGQNPHISGSALNLKQAKKMARQDGKEGADGSFGDRAITEELLKVRKFKAD